MDLIKAKKVILDNILRVRKEDDEKLVRITAKISHTDVLEWLKVQGSLKKIYWQDRSSRFTCAGIGESVFLRGAKSTDYAHIFKEIIRYLNISSLGVRFYGGFSFPFAKGEKEWNEFGNYYFFVPLFELIEEPTGIYFVCNLKLPIKDIDMIINQLEKIRVSNHSVVSRSVPIQYAYRIDTPDIYDWEKDAISIIEKIRNDKLIKVVLARKTSFKLRQAFDVYSFLKDPKWAKEKTYRFLIQLAPSLFFVSMSPERIYFRNDNYIETEAIAGTKSRGKTVEEDKKFSKELKNSVKEIQEHRLVSNMLSKRMSDLCTYVKLEQKEEILKLSYMQHLYTKFSGRLKDNISDDKIMLALYPNPAIAGYPIEESLKEIEKIERFDRGWYSGPFGWIGHNSVEFVVCIRSALAINNFLHLYSGAGLVQGSNPIDEWRELDNKILNFTNILQND